MEASATAQRRPPALLPPTIARLGGFAALALLGALQWQRMVEGLSSGRALLWVLVAVAAAAAVLCADRLRRLRRAVTLALVPLALLAAYASSGLPLALLKPRRIDELGAGLANGAEAVSTVQMPYSGADAWPADTLQLLGALLCVAAALLAFWPRPQRATNSAGTGGYPFLALALLLILVASPVVSLGGAQPVLLGAVLTALTVAFLWLERLPLRPGLGIAAMLALALAGALPLASAADGEDPWFDYKTFAEGLGPDEPLAFDWGHSYGPLAPREGVEVLRVATRRPSYWKIRNLDDFDGARWTASGGRLGGSGAEPDLARTWREQDGWRETLRVMLRRIQTRDVIGAGTTLTVEDASREVGPGGEPGIWRSLNELRGGDSYTVRAHVPRPRPDQLTEAGAGADPRREDDLRLTVPLFAEGTGVTAGRPVPVEISFPPFAAGRSGVTPHSFSSFLRSDDGNRALRRSAYARTWGLAKRLTRQAETPYEYVLAVNRYLQDGFSYNETPATAVPGRATLDSFLFDTRSGYCQHFSAAMAMLLRMGGVPARVVTGFSPGGYSKSKSAWVVRDSDAHSWVEAWFDEWGWVTFDPTPAGTPARSQIAALERPAETGSAAGDAASGSAVPSPRDGAPRPGASGSPSGSDAAGDGGDGGGGIAWWWFLPAVPLALALIAWCVLAWRRRSRGAAATLDRAVAELEAALRRAGRPAAAGTTLQQLELKLGRTPQAAAYLRALRTGRYAPTASPSPPPPGGSWALRRELAGGRGPLARLRALWALPPWGA